jgi:cell division protein FtsB
MTKSHSVINITKHNNKRRQTKFTSLKEKEKITNINLKQKINQLQTKIKTLEDFEGLRSYIQERNELENVAIINYILIGKQRVD